jgi:YVTN family beta-propeller protein
MRIPQISLLLLMLVTFISCGGSGHAPARVIATIQVGLAPRAVDINPMTNRIYILQGDRQGMTLPGAVSVIDGATNTVTATVPVGVSACQLAVNPGTNKIYVTNKGEQFVTVIDGATNNTTTINVGPGSCSLALNQVTNRIYVATLTDIVVIDDAINTVTHVAVTGLPSDRGSPSDVAVDGVANKIYVSTLVSSLGNLTVVDGVTNSTADVLLGRSDAANQIGNIVTNPTTNQIYASVFFYHGSWVANIDGPSLTVKSIANGDMYDPLGSIAANPTTNKVYVPYSSGLVSVIDGATLNVTSIVAGSNSHFIAVDPALNQTYVLNGTADLSSWGNTVTVIDGATNSTVTLGVDVYPIAASVNPTTHRVYVVNSCGNDPTCVYPGSVPGTVSVIEAAH